MFDNRISWQHKLGLIFFASGLAISLFIIGYMDYYSSAIGEIESVNYIICLSLLITGNVLVIVGINYLIIGSIDHYQMKRDALPNHPVGGIAPPQDTVPMRITICKDCLRQIPYDCILCPYCGMGQSGKSSITLKDK